MENYQLYDLGYSQIQDSDLLLQLIGKLDAIVIDVRFSPKSRGPQWRASNLQSQFGDRYIHIPELGNVNYKGGPIKLLDEDSGLAKLNLMAQSSSLVLMCVCSNRDTCHRLTIVKEMELRYKIISAPVDLTLSV